MFPPSHNKKHGFTLIEILIALFIFAIMATIASVALRRIFLSKQILEQHIQKIDQLQLAVAMIRLDLSQMIDRPVRSQQGQILQAITGTDTTITFTRTGNINPLGYFNMSNLQRISYSGNNGLLRSSWDVLDLAPNSKTVSRTLLPAIKGWKIKYYDTDLQIHSQWPVNKESASTSDDSKKNPLPTAVEIEFSDATLGKVDILVPIFAGNLHEKSESNNNAQQPTS